MGKVETLEVGLCTFTPRAVTRKWCRWYLTGRELLRRARAVNGDYGIEVAVLLQNFCRMQLPDSWSGRTFILPGSRCWMWVGWRPRCFVAALKQVGDEWKLLYRTVAGGFGPQDYFLESFPPPIR